MGARKIGRQKHVPRGSASVGMTDKRTVTLASLPNGVCAVITRMELSEETAWKFMEMGFGVGRRLRLVRRAPLGDPMEVELLGYRLAVRAQDVEGILVRPLKKGTAS